MCENIPLNQLLTKLGNTVSKGLPENDVKIKLEQYGHNTLSQARRKSLFMHVLCSFKDITIIILCVAMALSLYISLTMHPDNVTEPIVIAGIIVLNIILSVREQTKAEKSVDSLKNYNTPKCTVIRNGKTEKIDAELLVPGDIILLYAGDRVPADARILEEANLTVDESLLTGESEPAVKDAQFVPVQNINTADKRHMVFSGSLIVAGKCKAVVCHTGNKTEIGRISLLLSNEKPKLSPLQVRMQKLGKVLSIIAFVGALLALLIGWLYQIEITSMLMVAISVAVAAIPEVMPVMVNIALSYGIGNMAKRNTIVHTPTAVETIGNISVICSDKTGTLTQNKMCVQKIWSVGHSPLNAEDSFGKDEEHLLKLLLLSSSADISTDNNVGNPTELAIMRLAQEKFPELPSELKAYRKIHEIPFDSSRKRMTVLYKTENGYLSVTKGAIDHLQINFHNICQEEVLAVNNSFAEKALRVIGAAYKTFTELPELTSKSLETDLFFCGLIGMIDPPREESAHAVQVAKQAGIDTVMITGDHLTTAKAIAEQIGILYGNKKIMDGSELRSISDETLAKTINDYRVFARTSPEDKIRIVKAFQKTGKVVAMTGDGVNDAPALKAADVGIAMGSGTDVAKETADMILLDDNFSTIVSAVEEGRRVYSNVRKSLYAMLGCNFSALSIVLLSLIFGWGSPVTALQLLIIKVACDGIPGFSLCIEKADSDIMKQPPVRKNSSIFSDGLNLKIAAISAVFTIITLIPMWVGLHCNLRYIEPNVSVAQTMTFLVMGLSTIVHMYNCRSHLSLFKTGIKGNSLILITTILSAAIIILIATIPPIAQLFGLVSLCIWHWILVLVLSVFPFIFVEILKNTGYFKKI